MIVTNILVFAILSAMAAGSETPDERYPDDGRTRIVETSRFGTLRRKPLPQCIQDRIRNRRYFPAGDYTEEARRACERYYREHPERRPSGWKPQEEQLPAVQEETTGDLETTNDNREGETSGLGSISLDLSKGDLNALDALGLSIEDLEICCPLAEEPSTDDDDDYRHRVELDSISPLNSDSDSFFSLSSSSSSNNLDRAKVEHKGHNVTQPVVATPGDPSEDEQGDSDNEDDEAMSPYPPPTPVNSPRVSSEGDGIMSQKILVDQVARGNGLR